MCQAVSYALHIGGSILNERRVPFESFSCNDRWILLCAPYSAVLDSRSSLKLRGNVLFGYVPDLWDVVYHMPVCSGHSSLRKNHHRRMYILFLSLWHRPVSRMAQEKIR